MKTISFVSGCYNEEENVGELIRRIRVVMAGLPAYDYEIIFIDNSSEDRTVEVLKGFAAEDRRVKIIVNTRNFGQIRTGYHAMMQARGDAIVGLVSDLQEPPELVPEFIRLWESGYKVVAAIKTRSRENPLMYRLRGLYYSMVRRMASTDLLEQFTGFGLYDRSVVEVLRPLREPYPYFRGLISDIGFKVARVEYTQAERLHGRSKNNFFTLFDMAMLGLTSHTKIPLRMATLFGFFAAALSLLVGMAYLVAKLVFWYTFTAGMAPILIGIFFLGSVQLLFLGVVGEYVGAVFTYVQNRPLVIEKERVNFDAPDATSQKAD